MVSLRSLAHYPDGGTAFAVASLIRFPGNDVSESDARRASKVTYCGVVSRVRTVKCTYFSLRGRAGPCTHMTTVKKISYRKPVGMPPPLLCQAKTETGNIPLRSLSAPYYFPFFNYILVIHVFMYLFVSVLIQTSTHTEGMPLVTRHARCRRKQ